MDQQPGWKSSYCWIYIVYKVKVDSKRDFGCPWTLRMTERQLRTNYFSDSYLLALIFQAPGARVPSLDFEGQSTSVQPLPVDSLSVIVATTQV